MCDKYTWRQEIGLPVGIILFGLVLLLPTPEGLEPQAKRAAAVTLLMVTWWISEALPIAATALIPLALYPLLSIMDMKQVVVPYADPNIFLFMGGFMIAMAMQKWGLHKRLALYVITWVGGGPRRMLWGFMAATAFLSMWVSNTATTVMMLPIAVAVIEQMGLESISPEGKSRFGVALMLGIAYAASVGGVATLIGTPPNVIFAGQAKTLFPELGEVGFVRWMFYAFPLSVGFLIFVWVYLAFIIGHLSGRLMITQEVIQRELTDLGPWSRGERGVMIIFVLTVLAWIGRGDVQIGKIMLPGWTTLLGLQGIHDGTIAMMAALLLFAIPVRRSVTDKDAANPAMDFLLDWSWAKRLPWHVLLLFGGGFALAESFSSTGLDTWIGSKLELLQGIPTFLLVLVLCLGVTFLTEVTSNTATATMLMPILAAASVALGIHPYLLMIPATISASFAFMLPVATPPNAIVFGSGYLTIPQMAQTGFALNLMGAFWITLLTYVLATSVFDLPGRVP